MASAKTKQKKSWRIYIVCFFVITAIFPAIAILKRDPRRSSISLMKRYLLKACQENDEATIRELTTERGFLALQKIEKDFPTTNYVLLQVYIEQLPEYDKFCFPGYSIELPSQVLPAQGLTVFTSANYYRDLHGWRLDGIK